MSWQEMLFGGGSSVSASHIKDWASKIAALHITEEADPLTQVVKVAREQGLTPPQVLFLSTETNKLIHIEKFAGAENKYFAAEFPIVDSKKAIDMLQAECTPIVKVASAEMPDPFSRSKFDAVDEWHAKAAGETEKTASELKTQSLRKDSKLAFEKIALAKTLAQDEIFMSTELEKKAEYGFIEVVRQETVSEFNQKGRLEKLAMAAHAAKLSGDYELARKPLAKIAMILGKQRLIDPGVAEKVAVHFLEKKADETAPPELISETLKARVVNGNHPIIISLRTFKNAKERRIEASRRWGIIDEHAAIYSQKVRAL
jgi:hypothetical protein